MTTQRAVVFLLVTGGLVLFAVQNASPWHSLALFGMRTQPLPLSFWLVAAIAAGAITTLLMVGLFNLYGPEFRPKSPKMGRVGAKSSRMGGASHSDGRSVQTKSSRGRPPESPIGSAGSAASPNWTSNDTTEAQDWDTFKPPAQWDEWGQSPEPSMGVDTPNQDVSSTQGKSRRPSRRQKEQYAVEESFEEIAGGWDEYEESTYEAPAYIPRGGSPVDDALDDISTGWDGYEEPHDKPTPPPPPKDYEVKQAPKTVYRSGSLYSYSYDKPEEPNADSIEDAYPADEEDDLENDLEDEDYPPDTEESADNRQATPGTGRVGPDGVYEADYRVIIPPFRNLDETDDWEDGERR